MLVPATFCGITLQLEVRDCTNSAWMRTVILPWQLVPSSFVLLGIFSSDKVPFSPTTESSHCLQDAPRQIVG